MHSGRKVWGISWVEASPQRIPQHFLLEPGYFNTDCPVPISQPLPQQTLFTHLFPNKRRYISLPNVFPNGSFDFRDVIPQPIPIPISQPISQSYYQPITQHPRHPYSPTYFPTLFPTYSPTCYQSYFPTNFRSNVRPAIYE